MRHYIYILLIFLIPLSVCAQTDSLKMVKYTPDYKFKEGVYLNFEQVKNNNPVKVTSLITEFDQKNRDFFEKLVKKEKIEYFDVYGVRTVVNTKAIWGYSKNGTLFINWNDEFNRLPVIGSIAHFIAGKTVYRERMNDPFYYNPYDYSRSNSTYTSKELRQYLLDFKTGKVLEYSRQNVKILLMNDVELFDEYNALKKRKQKQLMFLYIRRFNERNPLFLPKI